MKSRSLLFIFQFLFWASIVYAQIPPGYYDGTEGLTGEELKAALHDIIKGHVEYSYSDLRDFILPNSDEDPDNSSNVILIYSGISRAKSNFGGGQGQWNREHVWAKSHGDFGTTPPAGTDAHHIRPADVQVNSIRGNLDFDTGGSPVPGAPGCKVDADSFEPRDAVKGDVARMIFYMAVRYEGDDGEPDLEVVDRVNTAPNPEHGKLSTLLLWNAQDPPDDFEMNRQEVVYDYQQNRNPFIDHPEFVDEIWGNANSVTNNLNLDLSCYPNPFVNRVFIEYDGNQSLTYFVDSMDGKEIETGVLQPGKSNINLTDNLPGLYVLVIRTENGRQVKTYKLLKTVR
ncbi:MAG: T9SS type A sorting domain-containing protein [Chlorobi bacterium]|nr:T9SS type A sorting domain-containing protein [Chlorobiota bacterium]